MKIIRHISLLIIALAAAAPLRAEKPKTVRDLRYDLTDSTLSSLPSLHADYLRMKEDWYVRSYLALDTLTSRGEPTSDDDYITRLQLIPTTIEMPFNQVVKHYIEEYVVKGRSAMQHLLGLSRFYMPIFESALLKEDLPLELRYLPIVESSLMPGAVSDKRATGLWQFMYDTGKSYGLEISTLVDERCDPVKSSEAAAKYLRELYNQYHDWGLAIAAYNCGPKTVTTALHVADEISEGPHNYWDIYHLLPSQTRGYMPKFIGATYAMNYYPDHDISPAVAKRPLLTDTVHVNSRMTFNAISSMLNIPVEELRILNPQYIRDIIPGDVKPYSLRLPSQMIYNYLLTEDSIRALSLASRAPAVIEPGGKPGEYKDVVKTHKVRKGETLGAIAGKYGVTVKQIMKWNNLKKDRIRIGQNLKIHTRKYVPQTKAKTSDTSSQDSRAVELVIDVPEPPSTPDSIPEVTTPQETTTDTAEAALSEEPEPVAETETEPEPAKTTIYKVKKGDSLFKIANRYNTTIDKIKEANGLTSSDIKVGSRLKIPVK